MALGRWLPLLVLVVMATARAQSPIPSEQEAQTSQAAQKIEADPSPKDRTPLILQRSGNPETAPCAPQKPESWKDAVWPPNWSNWAIFVVTLVYASFAGLQWLAIRDQGEHAARMERPWITCEPILVTGLEALNAFRAHQTPLPDFTAITLRYALKNGGRSVASVVDFGVRQVEGGQLPSSPSYPGGATVPQLWAPGFQREYTYSLNIPSTVLQSHAGDKPVVAVYGQIVYRGSGPDSPDYRSRFCLILMSRPNQASAFILGGPKGYNEYT